MTEPDQPLVIVQDYQVPADAVWMAITDHEQMLQWFFPNLPAFNPVVGFVTQFDVNTGERIFQHQWKIIGVVPGRQIVHQWRYEGYSGEGTVTFEVMEGAGGSQLRVTSEGLESFPQDVPEFSRESCEDGWRYLLQDSLKRHLESQPSD